MLQTFKASQTPKICRAEWFWFLGAKKNQICFESFIQPSSDPLKLEDCWGVKAISRQQLPVLGMFLFFFNEVVLYFPFSEPSIQFWILQFQFFFMPIKFFAIRNAYCNNNSLAKNELPNLHGILSWKWSYFQESSWLK